MGVFVGCDLIDALRLLKLSLLPYDWIQTELIFIIYSVALEDDSKGVRGPSESTMGPSYLDRATYAYR